MKTNQIKLLVIAVALFSVFAIVAFNTTSAHTITNGIHTVSGTQDDVAASYKKQCAMCHSPKAEKAFDPSLPFAEHVQIILKGKKAEKPPNMPGFEAKGMTEDQAKALTEYMLQLRNAGASNSNTSGNSNSDTSSNTNKSSISEDEVATTYKTKCAMCHSAKAEKSFDPAKEDEALMEVVLKGKSTAKPPMPAYEAKGMKNDEALALVAYMKGLRDGKKK